VADPTVGSLNAGCLRRHAGVVTVIALLLNPGAHITMLVELS
jgi:hypothetical protein